ncbi:GlxA family transcriptional regulator [Allonocardiopsis opalescens]|uniref:Transcriptional regulator GlxA family with amidase domain n=1 Tax=Allonocardiopsis opalescens TaxID=1144618 RepID=A0A2T0PXG0_9ACTN|nr:helix-turn-helix domain-containing protein [Allonocardiopsis opalescens]PRX96222.1 transcriptional regulator GlxA family with amidase domain [Allonocardiopsis opalescens]
MSSRPVVAIPVFPGVQTFELLIPCEVFGQDRSAYLGEPWYELRVCAEVPGLVGGDLGFAVRATHGLDGLADAGTLIVPAVPDLAAEPPPWLLAAVRDAHRRGARVASICTGAFVLAAAGLLDGRRATTHWMYADELARRHPAVEVDPAVLYVDEGRVLTAAGSGSALDLCLHIVRRDLGSRAAATIARRLVLPPHREGGQAQYVDRPVPTGGDQRLLPVLEWALARLDQPLSVADFAVRAAVSSRTLLRRFREATGLSPQQWLTEQRLRRARELLEATDHPVEEVSRRCGFATAASLREHFARTVGVSPQVYRRTFQAAGGIR